MDEKPNTTHVLINEHIIGILDQENTTKLKELISSSDIHGVSCIIQGGLYKIVDKDCNEEIQQKGISAVVKITHQPKAANIPAPAAKQKPTTKKAANKPSRKTTKKTKWMEKSKKKPFYKRTWFWILAAILALGSCGNETDTNVPTETTVPTTSIIQTEGSSTEVAAIVTTIPTTVATTEAYIAPVTEPPTVPYVESIIEEETITVYLSKTGSKYHSKPNCGRMKNGRSVTLNSTIKNNYEPCKICH